MDNLSYACKGPYNKIQQEIYSVIIVSQKKIEIGEVVYLDSNGNLVTNKHTRGSKYRCSSCKRFCKNNQGTSHCCGYAVIERLDSVPVGVVIEVKEDDEGFNTVIQTGGHIVHKSKSI